MLGGEEGEMAGNAFVALVFCLWKGLEWKCLDGNMVCVSFEGNLSVRSALPHLRVFSQMCLFGETSPVSLRAPFILLDEESGLDLWDLGFFCL